MQAIQQAILETVAYADVFDYPLLAAEIQRYLICQPASPAQVQAALGGMNELRCVQGYYSLPGREYLAAQRLRRRQISGRAWPAALRYGYLLAGLPLVRMVAVTGSLAVNNLDEGGDIDYLIVTRSRRLWLCRALVILVVRLAQLRGVRLCPNYLVTDRALEFTDQNIYTARETVQMFPLSGLDVYFALREENAWTAAFLPNAAGLPEPPFRVGFRNGKSLPARLVERFLLSPAGARLEQWEMARKIRKFRREQPDQPEAFFSAEVCKGHFQGHKQRAEAALRERKKRFVLRLHG